MTLVVGAVALLAALVLGVFFVQGRNADGVRARDAADLFTVREGSFDIVIPASGELVAAQQIEIRNRLELRAVISEIVPEGTTVRKDDLLLRLNDEEIRNRIKDAEDAVNSAESALVAAEANLAIRESAAASEYERAKLAVDLAKLALDAWEKGEVLARKDQLDLAVRVAKENYERLQERYRHSEQLHEQEFISRDELRRDFISMIEAEARVRQAENDREVYIEYTLLQEKMQKESNLEQAQAELKRVVQRHEAELETARADLASREHQLLSRKDRLADLRQQLEFCTVKAPADGLVVYVTSLETGGGRRGGNTDPPQVGTELSRNELVMVLPDTSRMIAAVKVNEALSGMIRRGQRARVTSDAAPDHVLDGDVIGVGVLAESGGWRDPNRRDYTVRIALQGGNEIGLRPSMRARADIFIDRVQDAVHVPVQSIFRDGRRAYVYVPAGRHYYERRPVTLGRASELYVEIVAGLVPGQQVLLRRPNAGEILGGALEGEQVGAPADEPRPQSRPGRDGAAQPPQSGAGKAPGAGALNEGERPNRAPGGAGGPGGQSGERRRPGGD